MLGMGTGAMGTFGTGTNSCHPVAVYCEHKKTTKNSENCGRRRDAAQRPGGHLFVDSDYSAADDCLPARFVEFVGCGRQPSSPARLLAAAGCHRVGADSTRRPARRHARPTAYRRCSGNRLAIIRLHSSFAARPRYDKRALYQWQFAAPAVYQSTFLRLTWCLLRYVNRANWKRIYIAWHRIISPVIFLSIFLQLQLVWLGDVNLKLGNL